MKVKLKLLLLMKLTRHQRRKLEGSPLQRFVNLRSLFLTMFIVSSEVTFYIKESFQCLLL